MTRFTLHLDEWSGGPRWTSAMVHDDASAMVHGDAPSTSNLNGEESRLETSSAALAEHSKALLPEWEVFFNSWWDTYPRKVGKPAAKRAMKAKYEPVAMRFIAYGTARWAQHWREAGTDVQFIPHPSTFLNQERYNDEPPPAANNRPKPNSPMGILQAIAERDHQ